MHETAPGATSLAGTAFPAAPGVQDAVACAAAAVGRFDCDEAGTVDEGNDGASLAGAAFPTAPNLQDPIACAASAVGRFGCDDADTVEEGKYGGLEEG